MIRPVDLIKIGELMLDQGCWHDQPVVPPEWVTAMVTQSQPFHADYGLLWWRDGGFASVLARRARRLARRRRARDHDRAGAEPARSPVRNTRGLSARARRVARPVCVRGARCDREAPTTTWASKIA